MIDPTGSLHRPSTVEAIVSGSGRSQASKSQSFAATLSDEFANSKTSGQESTPLSANPAVGQQSALRRDPAGPSSPTPGSTPSPAPVAAPPPTLIEGLVPQTASIAPTSPTSGTVCGTVSGTAGGTTASSQSTASFDDAYWASQPAAVQQLQTIQDPTQRAEAAAQLADEGYTIDVPIMAWGWDPQLVTQARESDGYTWVPSALQQPVEVPPGITFDGMSYNPANPPAGSITV
jgi:hypothetical protein